MTTATSVRFSEETGRKLDELAARTGRSKSFYVRQAVEQNIDRLISEYDILARVEEIHQGGETYTREEVEELLELDD
jgi:RHH-type transcriptional regulator, rel operon repressor / antitoxin RelB